MISEVGMDPNSKLFKFSLLCDTVGCPSGGTKSSTLKKKVFHDLFIDPLAERV